MWFNKKEKNSQMELLLKKIEDLEEKIKKTENTKKEAKPARIINKVSYVIPVLDKNNVLTGYRYGDRKQYDAFLKLHSEKVK